MRTSFGAHVACSPRSQVALNVCCGGKNRWFGLASIHVGERAQNRVPRGLVRGGCVPRRLGVGERALHLVPVRDPFIDEPGEVPRERRLRRIEPLAGGEPLPGIRQMERDPHLDFGQLGGVLCLDERELGLCYRRLRAHDVRLRGISDRELISRVGEVDALVVQRFDGDDHRAARLKPRVVGGLPVREGRRARRAEIEARGLGGVRRRRVALVDAEEVVADGDGERRLEEPLVPDRRDERTPGDGEGPELNARRIDLREPRVLSDRAQPREASAAPAASTRAWAARIVSSDCFALKLVSIARCPTCSAVSPPGDVRRRSSGTGVTCVDAGTRPGVSGPFASCAPAFAGRRQEHESDVPSHRKKPSTHDPSTSP